MIVEKLSILNLVGYFIFYIILHAAIGYWDKNLKQQIEKDSKNLELKTTKKWVGYLFKWFPAVYVLFLLLML